MAPVYIRFRRKVAVNCCKSLFYRRLNRVLWACENLVWKLGRYKVVNCFGDSHAAVFISLNGLPEFRGYKLRILPVQGATIFGLSNPNSKTNAIGIFREWMRYVPEGQSILFLLGEVDAGFIIWLRALKSGGDPEKIMEVVLRRYERFITSLDTSRLMLCSVPLPTIGDNQDWGEVANARKAIQASQRERTSLTLVFNRRIEDICNRHGIPFINLDPLSLDEDTGLVKDALLNKNRMDHHYETEAYVRLLAEELPGRIS